MSLPKLQLIGPDMTADDARLVADRFIDVLDAVGESMGHAPGAVRSTVKVGEVRVACDCCHATRAWDADAPGWVHMPDGHDYCWNCVVAA